MLLTQDKKCSAISLCNVISLFGTNLNGVWLNNFGYQSELFHRGMNVFFSLIRLFYKAPLQCDSSLTVWRLGHKTEDVQNHLADIWRKYRQTYLIEAKRL